MTATFDAIIDKMHELFPDMREEIVQTRAKAAAREAERNKMRRQEQIKLEDQEIALLIRLYSEQDLALDNLPYTDEFDDIVNKFQRSYGAKYGHRQLWRVLTRLRKTKRLVRKSRENSTARSGREYKGN